MNLKKLLLIVVTSTSMLQAVLPQGIVQFTTGAFSEGGQIRDVKIDSNGKIFACGYTLVSGQQQWTVACFTSNGFLDTTYNALGTPGYQRWNSNGSIAQAMVFQPDGKLVVVGISGGNIATLFRYTTSGAIDTGANALDISGGLTNSSAMGVAIDNTGTYILCAIARTTGTAALRLRTRITISDLTVTTGAGSTISSTNPGAANTFYGGATMMPGTNDLIHMGSFFGSTNISWLARTISPYNTGPASSVSVTIFLRNVVALDNSTLIGISAYSSALQKHGFFRCSTTFTGQSFSSITDNTATALPYGVGGGLTVTTDKSLAYLSACSTANSATPQPFISRIVTSTSALDPTFGTNGLTIQTESEITPGFFTAVALQTNGSIVVGGFGGTTSYWTLGRYQTNGTLDPAFGLNQTGILLDTGSSVNNGSSGFIYTTTIDQSGNIVVGGQYGTGALSIRYTSTAGRDGNFGNNGVANLSSLSATATVHKIINSGTGYLAAGVSNTNQFTTFKLTNTGGFDSTYNSNGIVVESTVGSNAAYDLLINGTALSVSGITSTNKLSVINYNTVTGARNSSLGNNGLQTFNNYGTGTIYALNTTTGSLRYGAGQSNNLAFVLPLYDQSGVLQDTASPFNTSTNGFIYTSTIDQSGNIVVGGQYNNGALSIRYTTSAGRDGNFGNNGVADLTALLTTATVQKIVNSSTGYLAAGVSSTNQFTTFKLTSTGGFDVSFNGNGVVTESTVGTSAAYDLLINGTALTVAGATSTNMPSVINYNTTTGARTSTIGNNGVQTFNNYGTGTMYALNTTTGTVRYGAGQGNNIAFVKELVDGTGLLQDTNPPFNTSQPAQIYGGIIDQDGNIVLCGNYNNILTLIRYTSVGERDDNFGIDHNGVAQYSLAGPSNAYSILQSTDGSYYVTGEITVNATTTLAVLKYTNGGLLDTSFGTNGVAQLPATFGQSRGYSIARNTVDGSLLIAGQVTVNAQLVPAFVLYDASGSLVTTFGSQGVQTFSQYGTGSLNTSLVSPSLFATGAGGISTLETNDQIATLVQVGQGSSTAAQISTGF